jgi:hypothetical protein
MRNKDTTKARIKNIENRLERIRQYNLNPKLCLQCHSPLPYEHHTTNKFCNTRCASLYNHNIRKLQGVRSKKRKPRYCPVCGKETPSRGNIFCKPYGKCDAIYRMNRSRELGLPIVRSHVRRYLILTRGYKCESCGLTEWKGTPIPLESHHKDGNYRNNEENNLELLCPNCHSITDTYRGKNRNKGRGEYKRR